MILPRVSPAAFLFPSLCMCHGWCLHANAHVWAFCVVEQDDTLKFLLAYLPCGYGHLIEPLSLKDAVGMLSHRIILTSARHRGTPPAGTCVINVRSGLHFLALYAVAMLQRHNLYALDTISR